MKSNSWLRFVTFGSVLGAIAVLALLLLVWGLILRSLAQPTQPAQAEPTAIIQVILAPTATPLVVEVTLTPTPTAEPTGDRVNTPVPNTAMKIGDYVQISGTGGDGLRIRSGPGTQNPALFLGMEAEVFKVIDGPKEVDGLVWFNLSAPYDENRKGWAASNYLTVIANKP
jgi:hypothetical protein